MIAFPNRVKIFNHDKHATPRHPVLAVVLLALSRLAHAQEPVTAADAIQKILRHYAPAPPSNSVDTIKAGDRSWRSLPIFVAGKSLRLATRLQPGMCSSG
jgi:hypothetical protein